MHKLRQVRLSYPDAFVDFAVALATDLDKRRVAAALSIPVSTLYRWLVERREAPSLLVRGWTAQRTDAHRARIGELVETCQRDGFDVRPALHRLLPGAFAATNSAPMERPLPAMSGRIIVGRFDLSRGLLRASATTTSRSCPSVTRRPMP